MSELLWFPAGILIVLGIMVLLNLFHPAKDIESSQQRITYDEQRIFACFQIIASTPTNNNYDPIGDVLADLDSEIFKTILGANIQASMEDFLG